MIFILIFILKLLALIVMLLIPISNIVIIFCSYLGYDLILYEIQYHFLWLSLFFYSLFHITLVLTDLREIFFFLKNREDRNEAISDFKYQLKKEKRWIRTSILFQLISEMLAFLKSVALILFRRFFK